MKSPIETEVVGICPDEIAPENRARMREAGIRLQEEVGRTLYERGQRMLANGEFK